MQDLLVVFFFKDDDEVRLPEEANLIYSHCLFSPLFWSQISHGVAWVSFNVGVHISFLKWCTCLGNVFPFFEGGRH